MSGHNRWSKIKRQKAAMGASKGKLFSKLIKEVTVAARLGGGDPANNARLRVAISAARDANMPGDTITRAVKKGTGELEGAAYEEVVYEGYGPGGVAVMVECLTDNRNRTASDVRILFDKNGGSLGSAGAVGWLFQRKGSIAVKPGLAEDAVMERALEAGAEDVLPAGEHEGYEVRTAAGDLHAVASTLEQGSLPIAGQRWVHVPQTLVRVEADAAERFLRLIDALEENEDVQNVHANAELDEAASAAGSTG